MTPLPEPKTAPASLRPCQMHRYHWPKPVRTQGHHRRPVYLQMRLYGEVRYKERLWSCGTDHDSIHAWIDWLLGEARKPDPEPGRRTKVEAQAAVDWYLAEKAKLDTQEEGINDG